MFHAARKNRLSRALDVGPAIAIVLVCALLWAWALAGVVAPLSRIPGAEGVRAAAEQRA